MTTTTQATASDRTRWQGRAIATLDKVFKKGAAAGLDPLTWQVGIYGLAGDATNADPTHREAVFRAWADLLGLPVRETSNPRGRLIATAQEWGPGRCPITLTADIYDEGDD